MNKKCRSVGVFECLSIVLILLFACGVVIAKGKKTLHPKDMFDHDMHNDLFSSMDVACNTCHTNDTEFEWKGMNHEGCHKCHKDTKGIMSATRDCSMCHANWPVTPANHKINWMSTHKSVAKASRNECRDCHTDRFCERCHEQRAYIKLQQHRRNYKYFHSIDARSNPTKCDRCHQVQFCVNCHVSPRGR